MDIVEFDDSYVHGVGAHAWGPSEYPFYEGSDGRQAMIECIPTTFFTAVADVRGSVARGVIAVARKQGGFFATLTAGELRTLAHGLTEMADYVEKMNKDN